MQSWEAEIERRGGEVDGDTIKNDYSRGPSRRSANEGGSCQPLRLRSHPLPICRSHDKLGRWLFGVTTMTAALSDLERQARSLSPDDRARLVQTLLDSLQGGSHISDVQAAWNREIEERVAAYDRGELKAFSAEDVFKTRLDTSPSKTSAVRRPGARGVLRRDRVLQPGAARSGRTLRCAVEEKKACCECRQPLMNWWRAPDSNWGPKDYDSSALTN